MATITIFKAVSNTYQVMGIYNNEM